MISKSTWSDSECIDIVNTLIATEQWNPYSILHLSVKYHRYAVLYHTLSQCKIKCYPNRRNLTGEMVVQLMSTDSWSDSECIEIIKTLIASKQWDPKFSCNSNKDTILHLSVKYHRHAVVHHLLSQCKHYPNIKNSKGETVIQVTMSTDSWSDSECIEVIKILKATKQWDPKFSYNSNGDTILHLSVKYHRCKLACYLSSEVKCNPNIKNQNGKTPIQLVILHYEWSDSECIDIIEALIASKQWNPKSPCNSKKDTILHLSVKYHRYDVVHYLISQCKCYSYTKNSKGENVIQVMMSVYSWSDSECVEIIKVLIATKQWNPNSSCNPKNDTILHLSMRYHRYELLHFLSSETDCNPNSSNLDKETPLLLATDTTTIKNLIRHGANPENVYKSLGKSVHLKKPLVPPLKVFIIGNSGVGKSTLAEALKIERSFLARAFSTRKRVSGVDEKTAGIVPYEFKSKHYGSVILYDFAGHKEFYNSHVAMMQNIIRSSSSIFLIVVNFIESKEIVQQNVLYWLSFLQNNCVSAEYRPHVIVIGSHADIVLARGDNLTLMASELSNSVQMFPHISSLKFIGMYPIDCRCPDSSSVAELRGCLRQSCKSLRIADTINFNAHCLHVFILDKFRMSVAVTIKDIQKKIQIARRIKEKGVVGYLPDTVQTLTSVCDELNDRGHIIFLKDSDNFENSWVIIDKASLLSKVTGTIFAPKDFKEHCQIAESTGVVPLSRLIEKFPDYDNEVLVGFLTHLEFFHEIKDCELLELISKHQHSLKNTQASRSENERYFLFPGLITLEAPRDVWKKSPSFQYKCGWIIKCCHQDQFFSSRFTKVLILRLAFSLAQMKQDVNLTIPALQRECSIWKNGIFWGETFGMEIIVEIQPAMVLYFSLIAMKKTLYIVLPNGQVSSRKFVSVHKMFVLTLKQLNHSLILQKPLSFPSNPKYQIFLNLICKLLLKQSQNLTSMNLSPLYHQRAQYLWIIF